MDRYYCAILQQSKHILHQVMLINSEFLLFGFLYFNMSAYPNTRSPKSLKYIETKFYTGKVEYHLK